MLRGVNNLGLEQHRCGALPPEAAHSFHPCRRRKRSFGFTLLELMIVISIIMILMAVAVPVYNQSIIQARESVLRSNLSTLRNVISQYTLDKQKAPQSLDDLVQAGYLRSIPLDPMTRQANWEVKEEDVMMAVDQQEPGITDVHSASNGTASDGTAYSSW
ncbi:MAG TPA: prepilin-type N-terminal cleavage/methylation domain-containing protein [Candidatus Sulfotelmatobacter sp.]|nr:prepilin-type N-terminal cleavage/methylation domain-containing protein [Candidatus Sulfotelmatobacter sp.]